MHTLPRTPAQRKPERRFLTIRFDVAERKRLKLLAAETGTSMTAIVTEAIRRYLSPPNEPDQGAPRIPGEGAPS